MRLTSHAALPALLALACSASPARAEVIVRVPFFSIAVGPGACPAVAGFQLSIPRVVDVQVRRASRVVIPPPLPAPVVTAPQAVIPSPLPAPVVTAPQAPPPPPLPVVVQPLPVSEFARTFRPAPGAYEVVLLNPVNNRPVKVNFTLPDGYPRKVKANRRELVFDYGRHWVKIRFTASGARVISR
jgi:hypothetical protein